MVESQRDGVDFWYLLVLERIISHWSALRYARPLLASWLLICGLSRVVDFSHKRKIVVASSWSASGVSRAAPWATFLTTLTSLTSLLNHHRTANLRVPQRVLRFIVVRRIFRASADSTFIALIDPMAMAIVIFKASFAHIAARLAIIVDRVLHRLKHIAEPLNCVVLVKRMVFITSKPLIVEVL